MFLSGGNIVRPIVIEPNTTQVRNNVRGGNNSRNQVERFATDDAIELGAMSFAEAYERSIRTGPDSMGCPADAEECQRVAESFAEVAILQSRATQIQRAATTFGTEANALLAAHGRCDRALRLGPDRGMEAEVALNLTIRDSLLAGLILLGFLGTGAENICEDSNVRHIPRVQDCVSFKDAIFRLFGEGAMRQLQNAGSTNQTWIRLVQMVQNTKTLEEIRELVRMYFCR